MKIIFIGGRGTAIVIAEQMYDARKRFGMDIEVLGLALDDHSDGNDVNGYPILCNIKDAYEKYRKYDDVKFIYQLYRPDVLRQRTKILYDLAIPDDKFCTFIHPSAMVARSTKIGMGTVLLANTVVNANAVIGKFCTVNSSTLIGHDTVIRNNNYFAAHVCVGSRIVIGNMNFIGLNTSLNNGITIGDGNIIGMQSCVTKDIANDGILYGNPVRLISGVKDKYPFDIPGGGGIR